MTEEQKSCEQKIDEELRRLMADVREMAQAEDRDKWIDENGDPLDAIGISKYKVIQYQMSWGGPSDEFEIWIDLEAKTIERIIYIYMDWYDGARREVTGEDFDLLAAELEYLAYD